MFSSSSSSARYGPLEDRYKLPFPEGEGGGPLQHPFHLYQENEKNRPLPHQLSFIDLFNILLDLFYNVFLSLKQFESPLYLINSLLNFYLISCLLLLFSCFLYITSLILFYLKY